jgi:hypothetical protein
MRMSRSPKHPARRNRPAAQANGRRPEFNRTTKHPMTTTAVGPDALPRSFAVFPPPRTLSLRGT